MVRLTTPIGQMDHPHGTHEPIPTTTIGLPTPTQQAICNPTATKPATPAHPPPLINLTTPPHPTPPPTLPCKKVNPKETHTPLPKAHISGGEGQVAGQRSMYERRKHVYRRVKLLDKEACMQEGSVCTTRNHTYHT